MSTQGIEATQRAATGSRGFHGFLFADLRGYTDFVERHGDQQAAALLAAYRELVRAAVAEFSGAEIKTEGDSFYVVFDSASDAVLCGLAIVARAEAEGATGARPRIEVGVGVHAGETVSTTEGFVGSAVNIAARVCAQAAAGEVLVTETVRSLTRTSLDVGFVSLGARPLKGITEPIALFRVIQGPEMLRQATASAEQARRRRLVRRSLTGATAVGAVALILIGAIVAAESLGRQSPGPTISAPAATGLAGTGPAATPSEAVFPDPGEAYLLSLLPAKVTANAVGCTREAPADLTEGASDGISCSLQPGQGAATLYFERFSDPSALISAYTAAIGRLGVPAGDCSKQAKASSPWTLPGFYSGHLVCYQDSQGSWLLWTYEGSGLLGRANRADTDSSGLYEWWTQVAYFLKR